MRREAAAARVEINLREITGGLPPQHSTGTAVRSAGAGSRAALLSGCPFVAGLVRCGLLRPPGSRPHLPALVARAGVGCCAPRVSRLVGSVEA